MSVTLVNGFKKSIANHSKGFSGTDSGLSVSSSIHVSGKNSQSFPLINGFFEGKTAFENFSFSVSTKLDRLVVSASTGDNFSLSLATGTVSKNNAYWGYLDSIHPQSKQNRVMEQSVLDLFKAVWSLWSLHTSGQRRVF